MEVGQVRCGDRSLVMGSPTDLGIWSHYGDRIPQAKPNMLRTITNVVGVVQLRTDIIGCAPLGGCMHTSRDTSVLEDQSAAILDVTLRFTRTDTIPLEQVKPCTNPRVHKHSHRRGAVHDGVLIVLRTSHQTQPRRPPPSVVAVHAHMKTASRLTNATS